MHARSRSFSSGQQTTGVRALPPAELSSRREPPCRCAPLLGRLGRRLAAATDLESLADAVIEELSTLPGLSGVEFEVATPEGLWRVLRRVGAETGRAAREELSFEGERVACITIWAPATELAEVLEVLDFCSGWLALGFGSALLRRRRADAERVAAREVLARVAVAPAESVSRACRLSAAAARWSLSARQTAVLGCLCEGLTNKEIGQVLHCAEVTVEKHLSEIYQRSGLEGRTRVVSEVCGGLPERASHADPRG